MRRTMMNCCQRLVQSYERFFISFRNFSSHKYLVPDHGFLEIRLGHFLPYPRRRNLFPVDVFFKVREIDEINLSSILFAVVTTPRNFYKEFARTTSIS
jgi:hypothetical protein